MPAVAESSMLKLWFLMLFALAPQVAAHSLSVAYLHVEQAPDGCNASITLDVALADLELEIGLDANADGAITWGELRGRSDEIARFVRDGVKVTSGGSACRARTGALAVREYADGMYAHQPLSVACESDDISLAYGLLLDRDAQHRAMLVIGRDGATTTSVLDAGHRTAKLAAPRGTFESFAREGVRHILIGYDHLAFLASLLLAVAFVRREGRWQRAGSLWQSFRRAAIIVTAFTVAHSVTLSLAALGLVTPAGRAVESLIALSVVLAALNNVFPVVVRRLWLLAMGFGLVHGFGFAGALGELGIPRDARLTALFAFNVGVELGQLAVAAVALPVIHALSGWRHYVRWLMIPLSLLIALLGAWWFFDRIAG